MQVSKLPLIRRRLLGWYNRVRRDLPWRRSNDPYAIWIAETMLQQTQVTTMVPYFERFLKTFPTVQALDHAPLSRVLALWSGLGYYRRAENLKRAVRAIMRQHQGRVPDDYESLVSLPGIGAYTAGALMSIAFGRRVPALDGNSYRVLSRYFGLAKKSDIQRIAARLVPQSRPGTFNQGLMELGATICRPRKPRCRDCPIAPGCKARRNERRMKRSCSTARQNLKKIVWPLAIVRNREKLLLRRRAANGLLSGLWEFPGVETSKSPLATLKRELCPLNLPPQRLQPIGEVRHSITNKQIRSPLFLVSLAADGALELPSSRWRWVPASSLRRYPMSSMTLKAAKTLAAYEKTFL